MKIFVIFAIGYSPKGAHGEVAGYVDGPAFDGAYGNVTGYVDVPSFPKVGDQVCVLHDEMVRATVGFSGSSRVTGVLLPQKEEFSPEEAWIVLEGVAVSSRDMATTLCAKMEEESGLSCDEHPSRDRRRETTQTINRPEPVHCFDRYFGARFGGPGRPTFFCAGRWEEAATQTFLQHVDEITHLDLLIQEGERIDVPPLGESALCVKRMWITYRGALADRGPITGLEQFLGTTEIHVSGAFPENGIDFQSFPGLRRVGTALEEAESRFLDDIFASKSLREVEFWAPYADVDCRRFAARPELTSVEFHGGPLETLDGLDACTGLEALHLRECRAFTNAGDLTRFAKLQSLSLDTLPGLQCEGDVRQLRQLKSLRLDHLYTLGGSMELDNLHHMECLRVTYCPELMLDLAAIGEMTNLRELWINRKHVNLDWETIFSLPHLEGLTVEGMSKEELRELGDRYGRKVFNCYWFGSRKQPLYVADLVGPPASEEGA